MIRISGLKHCDILIALYNRAKPLGRGHLQFDPKPMTVEQAQKILAKMPTAGSSIYFEYLSGRVMKVDIVGPDLDPRLYDRDNGEGAALEALQPLLENTAPTAWERMNEDE